MKEPDGGGLGLGGGGRSAPPLNHSTNSLVKKFGKVVRNLGCVLAFRVAFQRGLDHGLGWSVSACVSVDLRSEKLITRRASCQIEK